MTGGDLAAMKVAVVRMMVIGVENGFNAILVV